MSITIDGTTGISGNNGSASTPAIQGEDTNTGVFFPAADTVAVATAGAERMRVNSAGFVGIGTSSPGARLEVYQTGEAASLNINNPTATGISTVAFMETGSIARAQIWAGNGSYASFGGAGSLNYSANSGPHVWYTNYTERARITAGGDFQFNSGYGSVSTVYGCRAWVKFNGSNGSIYGSGGVSSVTYNGTGQSTVNFSTAMPDTNYSAVCSAHSAGFGRQSNAFPLYNGFATGSCVIWYGNTINAAAENMSHVNVAVFR